MLLRYLKSYICNSVAELRIYKEKFMSNYPYTTGVRLLIIPVAIAVGVIVGLLVKWDAGLLAGIATIILAPVLFMVFSKRLRKPLMDEEAERNETKKVKKFERKEKINELLALVNGTPVSEGLYWTSVKYSKDYVWHCNMEEKALRMYKGMSQSLAVRPVKALEGYTEV